jgi:hypothetical protein
MRRLLLLTVLLAGTLAVPAAGASGQPGPVADCNAHGQLTHAYSAAQLRSGLNTMPADIKEYTDCYDVIQRQLLGQLGKPEPGAAPAPSSDSSSGGSFLPTPVIVVLVVLILVAAGFGALALRRRSAAGGGDDA